VSCPNEAQVLAHASLALHFDYNTTDQDRANLFNYKVACAEYRPEPVTWKTLPKTGRSRKISTRTDSLRQPAHRIQIGAQSLLVQDIAKKVRRLPFQFRSVLRQLVVKFLPGARLKKRFRVFFHMRVE
jgi:hypothetical protein